LSRKGLLGDVSLENDAAQQGLTVLTYTSLFPNRTHPLKGIFIWQRVASLARRAGVRVAVIAPVPYAPRWLPLRRISSLAMVPRQEKMHELAVHHPRYFLLPKFSMPLHGCLMFSGTAHLARRLHRKMQFDCIDAHYIYPDGFAAALIGKMLKIPVIVSARGTDVNLFPSFPTIRPMICWTFQQATGIITVSHELRQKVLALGAASEKVQVIGNGVDVRRFHAVEEAEARRRLGLAANAKVIVSVGALVPYKGFQHLIVAVGQLRSVHPNLKVNIIGDGSYRPALERLIREHSLQDHVYLLGSVANDELKYWFSAADLSCLFSSREGQPNVVLESLACGAPVVATRVGGSAEILAAEQLGVLVDQNQGSITRGLQQALNTQWDRRKIAGYGASRTWETVSAEVERFLLSRTVSHAGTAHAH
jgi:teichuronic acid biosynthesis glycosyltransferase TuaC